MRTILSIKQSSLQIVQAKRSHLRTILSIEQQSFNFEDQYTADDFSIFLEDYPQDFYVIKDHKTIIAYMVCYKIKTYYYIHSIAVSPLSRGKGLGEWMFTNHILPEANRLNCKSIRLEVNTNNKPAIGLYTKMGFKKKVFIPDYYQNGDPAFRMVFTIKQNKL